MYLESNTDFRSERPATDGLSLITLFYIQLFNPYCTENTELALEGSTN